MTAQRGYIIAPQAAIEITTDEYGDVTLAQGDNRIVIRASNLATLAEIIIDIDNGRHASDDDPIDDGAEDNGPAIVPARHTKRPKDPTAAERQRRYRERKRNGA